MTDHRREIAANSLMGCDPHLLLLAGSRAGKGRSIILPDRFDGPCVVEPDDINPKPTIGAAHDPAR